MALTLTTWNLKGSKGIDVAAVCGHLQAVGADVVALQEVQPLQARGIARGLEAQSLRWGFKHWPIRTWPEGMAVIGVTRRAPARTRALSHRFRPWSWRRRIMQIATVALDPPVVLINAHLSPHARAELRAREVALLLAARARRSEPVIVAGDLNDRPGADIFRVMGEAGLTDAWTRVHPAGPESEGATNWHGWRPGTADAPGRRLDYVLVPEQVQVTAAAVPRHGEPGFARFATLSDHLPLTVTLDL